MIFKNLIMKYSFDKILISPKKLKFFVRTINNINIIDAYFFLLNISSFKKAKILLNKIKLIIANLKLKAFLYYIKEIKVTKSIVLIRSQPRAKGRAFKIQRKYSYLTIIVSQYQNSKIKNIAIKNLERFFTIYFNTNY